MAPRLFRKAKRPAPVGEGSPVIPFTFDPPGHDFVAGHLDSQDVTGGQRIAWPLIGRSIFVPDRAGEPAAIKFFVDLDTIEQTNSDLKIYGLGGFSLGDYHEFFLDVAPAHRAYRFGTVEASFGQGSPLLARLFWNVYYEKYWGEWGLRTGLRIKGCSAEEVERYVIAACLTYQEEVGVLPRVEQIDQGNLIFDDDIDVEEDGQGVVSAAAIITDLHPLRFYVAGLTADAEAACLAFYRVLEFYAFKHQATQVTALRADMSVSDDEFTKRALKLAARDDKGPLLTLIKLIASDDVLEAALEAEFIDAPSRDLLGKALYAYRNAIVHGKFGSAFDLRSQTVLRPNAEGQAWRPLLQALARDALQKLGTRA